LDEFVATLFGRTLRKQALGPTEVNGFGIFLADKNPGPFKLEIE